MPFFVDVRPLLAAAPIPILSPQGFLKDDSVLPR
jgi:hypothetical protein